MARILPRLGTRQADSLGPADIATLVTELHAAGLKRESIRKTLATLSMVTDFADAPLAGRLRTAIRRACIAAGVPSFSPHDLRHRRISLRHLQGDPWARIGEDVGERNLAVTANTYTHVLSDEAELD